MHMRINVYIVVLFCKMSFVFISYLQYYNYDSINILKLSFNNCFMLFKLYFKSVFLLVSSFDELYKYFLFLPIYNNFFSKFKTKYS